MSFLKQPPSPVNVFNRIIGAPGRDAQGASAALLSTADVAYAYYAGKAGENRSSIDVCAYVSGSPAAGAGYCEIAIAKSPAWSALQANVNLTILGFASIDAEVKAAVTGTYAKTISGVGIRANDDLWVVVAGSYATTQASFRVVGGDGDRSGVGRRRAACRPSTNLNTPLAFAYSASQAVPIMWAQI